MKCGLLFCLSLLFLTWPARYLSATPAQGEQELNVGDLLFYKDHFEKIESFGVIVVNLKGDAERSGLHAGQLTDSVRTRFESLFGSIKYKSLTTTVMNLEKAPSEPPKNWQTNIGVLRIQVWVVGNRRSHVALHVRCEAGNIRNVSIWNHEFLDFGVQRELPRAVGNYLNECIESLAAVFSRVRAKPHSEADR